MKRGTPEHPKTIELAEVLGIPRYAAVGLLELLWHATAKHYPDGDIGRWANRHIAKAVYWDGDADAFVAALIACGWLDAVDDPRRLVVHDWQEHADDAVKRRWRRRGESVDGGTAPWSAGQPPDMSGHVPTSPDVTGQNRVPEPEPEPEPEEKEREAPVGAARATGSPSATDADATAVARAPDEATGLASGRFPRRGPIPPEWEAMDVPPVDFRRVAEHYGCTHPADLWRRWVLWYAGRRQDRATWTDRWDTVWKRWCLDHPSKPCAPCAAADRRPKDAPALPSLAALVREQDAERAAEEEAHARAHTA
jgi:hypothetical protein